MQIYVGTYHKFNDGCNGGDWINLTDFQNKEDFLSACKELHTDEPNPEFMFQDWENLPLNMVSESWIDEDIFGFAEYIESNNINLADMESLIPLWNEYCTEHKPEDYIYGNLEFYEVYIQALTPEDAFRAGMYSQINISDNYIILDGYGNPKSLNEYSIKEYIQLNELVEWIIKTKI